MKSFRLSCLLSVFIFAQLKACESSVTLTLPPGTPFRSTQTVTSPDPTDTPDPQELIEAAVILSMDFEHGYPPYLLDYSETWHVETENDTNSVLCNEISDEWTSFSFGQAAWEDYAIRLQMRFVSAGEEQQAGPLIRINMTGDGYRANLFDDGWVTLAYYPPYSELGSASVVINPDEWSRVQLQAAADNLKFSYSGNPVIEAIDDTRTSGWAAFAAAPGAQVCVDNILVWALDENGNPFPDPEDLAIAPYDGTVYSIDEKVENRGTIPVFYPWPSGCGQLLWFDCDTEITPFSLVWTVAGDSEEVDSTQPTVSSAQRVRMQSDPDTLYLVSDNWHFWNPSWNYLSPDSIFYLNELFSFDPDYIMINFEHPDWPGVLAEKALNYKEAGFDGMMLDWWHNSAGNGRSPADVEAARMSIAKAIRMRAGEDFILLGNVNWRVDDPTAMYLSGVFLELYKASSYGYSPASIERMENLLIYWDTNLQPPKIIAFEPWKITTDDYIADRYTEENIQYAKLFTAMGVVIPENGYILYADNNNDWEGGDHQHAYYDFYHTDFGKPISDMVEVRPGVAYKRFENGLVAYNRTESEAVVRLPYGQQFTIGPLEGLFLEGYFR